MPLRMTKSGTVDRRCSMYRSGDVRVTSSGAIDRRSSACKNGSIKMTSSGAIDKRSGAFSHSSTSSPPSPVSIQFNADGTVRRTSGAVRSGDVLVTKSGSIDQRSKAVRNSSIRLKNGTTELDRRYSAAKSASYAVDVAEVHTKAIRDPAAQARHRKASKSKFLSEKEADHITSLDLALHTLRHKPGPQRSEAALRESLMPLNSQLRMVSRKTNRITNVAIDREIKGALDGAPPASLSRGAVDRLGVIIHSLDRAIKVDKGNGDLQFIRSRFDRLHCEATARGE
eukprot:gnl/Chilomastix_cuspidata/4953.p1 GENE.gnl/Chilomastix_cuspidata/4953~~gnl/Chilomastix_cuspidata/4953.p1  ORF type:complete len:298 (-),score=71.99 gnl/Chilomastix_cuspidata/4953:446-1297(-)